MSGDEPWQRTAGVIARGPEIVIVQYDPRWPDAYLAETRRIAEATGDLFLKFEHVGSTAVVGLAGKPVVDILAGVRSLEDVTPHLRALAELGYIQVPFLPGRLFFLKRGLPDSYNIHVILAANFGDEPQLLFRNYLLAHPEAVDEYARLKCEIVKRIKVYQEYMPAKAEFIESILTLARRNMKR
jgi:GrpB-like predicted nucleotidyltransferase (UPF0157 family)